MTKIARDMDLAHQKVIESLNRKHDRQVKRMNDIHDQNTDQIRKGQSIDILSLQEKHEHQVADENEKTERVLNELRERLVDTRRMTDKQLKDLEDFKAKEVGDINTKFANDRERISSEHNENLTGMNDKFIEASRRINTEGQERVNLLTDQQNEQYADRASHFQRRLDEQNIRETTRFKKDSENFLKIKNDQDKEFKKERMATHRRQDDQVIKMVDAHRKNIKDRDTIQRQDLKGQELFFEKRYAETYKRHNGHFKELDGLHDKVVKKMQADLTKKVDFKNSREQDPFFQFVELKPTLEQTEQGVRIQVQVPDHSKQDLQLNLNGKEAVINFNRRYIDTQKDEQGNSSRVSKIETLSTRLQTGVHLDPKSVKSFYKDGVMTYEIKKA